MKGSIKNANYRIVMKKKLLLLLILTLSSCGVSTNHANLTPLEKSLKAYEYNEKAGEAFKQRNYSQAAHFYSLAIDLDPKDEYLYYNRGVSNYNREKYKKAIEDFNRCLTIPDCDKNIQNKASEMLKLSKKYREEQVQRRAALWSAFALAALGVTAAVMSSNYGNGSSSSSYTSPSSGLYVPDPSLNYLLDPNYAVQQVQSQNIAEYTEFCKYNKKADGTAYTYEEWQMMKAEAYQRTQNSASDSNTHETKVKSSDREDRTTNSRYGYKTCSPCLGNGKCSTCNGKGYFYSEFGTGKVLCPNCDSNHNGVCCFCHGTKKVYGLVN